MLYIATNDLQDMFYLVDEYGNVARSIMCSHVDDLLTYCEQHNIEVGFMND